MKIDNNLSSIIDNIPKKVTLVAVSKTKPKELIKNAYDCGQRDFGENKVQELVNKFEILPKDIKWHMIGHLQRNKVKYIAPFVYLIHSVDSVRLLNEINKQAKKNNKTISVLLQIDISDDNTKFGFSFNEIDTLLNSDLMNELNNVKIEGLMGMASFTKDKNQIRNEFKLLKSIYDKYQSFKILSMGMSGDYSIAIEEGSNMIRVGSKIFGERFY